MRFAPSRCFTKHAAMYGFDKFKQTIEQIKTVKLNRK